MTAIFRAPTGLQDFLGTKSVGRNPDQLLQQVRPVVDLSQFWLQGAQWTEQSETSGTLAAPGVVGGALTVPFGHVWIPVMGVTVTSSLGVTDAGRARPAIIGQNAILLGVAPVGNSSSSTINQSELSCCWDFTGRIVLVPAGCRLGAYAEQVTAVTTGVQVFNVWTYLDFLV